MTEVAQKRAVKELKKKTDICDKEVLALTGGLYPLALQSKKAPVFTKWVQEPISLYSGLLNPGYHWVPSTSVNQPYVGSKYDIEVETINFTKEDYDRYLAQTDQTWTYDETKYLFDLCKQYDTRFIVVADRYDYPTSKREIFDIKERYFFVTSKLLQVRQQTTHPLCNYVYESLYDQKRIQELEKYLKRDKNILEDERRWMEDIKKVDVLIRKQEKEQLNIRRTIKMDNSKEDEVDQEQIDCIVKLSNTEKQQLRTVEERFVYLRSAWINEQLQVSPKLQKKLENWIKELVPLAQTQSRIIYNEETEELYDKVRHSLLLLFSEQRLEKRREAVNQLFIGQEKKKLEDKIKQLRAQMEQSGTTAPQQNGAPTNDRHGQVTEFDRGQQTTKKQKVGK